MNMPDYRWLISLAATCLLLAGCSVETHGKAAQRQIINEKQVIRILSCILRCYDCHKNHSSEYTEQ